MFNLLIPYINKISPGKEGMRTGKFSGCDVESKSLKKYFAEPGFKTEPQILKIGFVECEPG
jgi:hypothetical protein